MATSVNSPAGGRPANMQERNRRAVITVLRKHFAGPAIESVFEHWLSAHKDDGFFPIMDYLDSASRDFGWSDEVRKNVRVDLYAAILDNTVPLDDDPRPDLGMGTEISVSATDKSSHRGNESIQPPEKTPASVKSSLEQVFAHFYEGVVETASRESPADWPELIVATKEQFAASNAYTPQSAVTVDKWAARADAKTPPGFNKESECANFAHVFYLAICDVFGPVIADRSIGVGLNKARQSPASADFDPQKFV